MTKCELWQMRNIIGFWREASTYKIDYSSLELQIEQRLTATTNVKLEKHLFEITNV